jgi:hypothetical protein
VVGPERSVAPVPATDTLQAGVDVASAGTNRLVVWRSEEPSTGGYAILAVRVDASGAVLDPDFPWILLTLSGAPLGDPAVAYIGGNYLVVWQQATTTGQAIYAGRVTPSGTPLEPGGFIVTQSPAPLAFPAVGFDGTNALVTWGDTRNSATSGQDVYGALVSPAGTVVANDLPISTAPGFQGRPAVSFDGTRYLVAWADIRTGTSGADDEIYAARVNPAGAVLDTTGFNVSNNAGPDGIPDASWDGQNHLVTWTEKFNGAGGVRAARIAPSGAVVDTPPLTLPSGTNAFDASVAFNGTSSQVVWTKGSPGDIYGARVGTDGAILDGMPKEFSSGPGSELRPEIASGPQPYVVWHDDVPSAFFGGQAFGARVRANGTALDAPGRLLSTRLVNQFAPATASDGSNQLVVWSDDRNNATSDDDIYAARVSSSGQLLDQTGFVVTAGAAPEGTPAVAFGASTYLVVWKDDPSGFGNADLYAQRVATNGTLLGGRFLVSGAAGDQSEPTVTFDGTNFLVAWTDPRGSTVDIYATYVSPTGSVLNPTGIAVSTAAGSQSGPAAASDGTNSMVVWSDFRGATRDIYGTRITASGTVQDPSGIPIQTGPNSSFRPSLAYGGGTYLAVWDENLDNIYGARVTPGGVVQEPGGIPISLAPDSQGSPSVAYNGTFLVAWEDRRSGVTHDIYATRVDADGVVQETDGVPVSTGPTEEFGTAVAPSGSGWTTTYIDDLGDPTSIQQRTVSPK